MGHLLEAGVVCGMALPRSLSNYGLPDPLCSPVGLANTFIMSIVCDPESPWYLAKKWRL